MKNKVIFFDIDYTLFNTQEFRQNVYKKIHKLFPAYSVEEIEKIAMDVYDAIREKGPFNAHTFSEEFVRLSHIDASIETIETIWWDKDVLTSSLYPETEETLQLLEKKGIATLGIFSSGGKLQKEKIHSLKHFFHDEHIHVHFVKEDHLEEVLPNYEDKEIYFVDDYIPVLEKIKRYNAKITTIWIKRGRIAEKFTPTDSFSPDFTIVHLKELFDILDIFDN